jgi:hypothetical protein
MLRAIARRGRAAAIVRVRVRFDQAACTASPYKGVTSTYLRSVCGRSGSDVFVVGTDGLILHYDGSAWRSMSNGTSSYLLGVWCIPGSDVYAAGNEGTILVYR